MYQKDGKNYGKKYGQKSERKKEPQSSGSRSYSARADRFSDEASKPPHGEKRQRTLRDTESAEAEAASGAVPGRNAVRELLKSGRDIEKIFVRRGDREGSITVLVSEAINRKIPVIETEKEKLDKLCGYEHHQGIVAIASEKQYCTVDDMLEAAKARGEAPLLLIADGVSDPHNLGAIIRTAECAGAHGVIIPKRRAACLTPAVSKASAGALEHVAVAKCGNVSDTVRKLKERGLWIFSAEAGGTAYTEADFRVPAAIIVGSEESGVSEAVKKNSDFVVAVPMFGKVNSLNVSAAAAILLYEAVRQRTGVDGIQKSKTEI